MTLPALVIGIDISLIVNDILLSDVHGTKTHLESGHDDWGDVGWYIIIVLLVNLKFKWEKGIN